MPVDFLPSHTKMFMKYFSSKHNYSSSVLAWAIAYSDAVLGDGSDLQGIVPVAGILLSKLY